MVEHTKTYYDWRAIRKALMPDSEKENCMVRMIDGQKLTIDRETNYKNESYMIEIYFKHFCLDELVVTTAKEAIYYIRGWLTGKSVPQKHRRES